MPVWKRENLCFAQHKPNNWIPNFRRWIAKSECLCVQWRQPLFRSFGWLEGWSFCSILDSGILAKRRKHATQKWRVLERHASRVDQQFWWRGLADHYQGPRPGTAPQSFAIAFVSSECVLGSSKVVTKQCSSTSSNNQVRFCFNTTHRQETYFRICRVYSEIYS